MVLKQTRRELVAGTLWSCLFMSRARAQLFPSQPIRFLVGAAAGSTPDIIARLVGDQLSEILHEPVVIENRPGPGGIGAIQALLGSPPDGRAVALATVNQMVLNPYLFANLPYDPLGDLSPISLLVSNAFSIAVAASSENSFQQLVEAAAARKSQLLVGTSLPGTVPHVYAHLLMRIVAVTATYVPYRSGAEGLTALLRGDVHVLIDSPAIMTPFVERRDIRVLAVTGSTREPQLPDTPTIAQIGYPDAQYESWFGLVTPAHTPEVAVARLHDAVSSAVLSPAVQERLNALSFKPRTGTSEDFTRTIREERERWGATIRDAGIRLE